MADYLQSHSYRPHIDGLRALAVIAVVMFHAGVPGFGGGFIGVDVFFVISGYLIIGLLFREFEQTGDLSLGGFFERRVRRLAPALVVVLIATLVLGAIFLTPIGGEQQGLAKSTIATVGLVSNLYFAQTTGGYFDGPGEVQPLLHTWSLSVEEQFYLFWPLVVLVAGRLAIRRRIRPEWTIGIALVVLMGLSFALSVWMTPRYPQLAFYISPTRAWEFAVGGLCYFWLRGRSRPIPYADSLACLGLVAIALSIVFFEAEMVFPGYTAALPVVGAAAIIVGNEQAGNGWCRRLLSLPTLVLIGLLSYGWYLWHWPLLVIARLHEIGKLGPWLTAAICLLSLALAWVTLRFIEDPLRHKRVKLMATPKRALAFGVVSAALLVAVAGGMGVWAKRVQPGLPGNAEISAVLNEPKGYTRNCNQLGPYEGRLFDQKYCLEPPSARGASLLLWGDSHAVHLVPMLKAGFTEVGGAILIRYKPQCPPMLGYSAFKESVRSLGCEDYNADVIEEAAELRQRGLKAVLVAAIWPSYTQDSESLAAAREGLRRTLAGLQGMGLRVLVAGPLPILPFSVPQCLARRPAMDCAISRADAEMYRRTAMKMLREVTAEFTNVVLVDPLNQACGKEWCMPTDKGALLYKDSHHLSHHGSRQLLPAFQSGLEWAVGNDQIDHSALQMHQIRR